MRDPHKAFIFRHFSNRQISRITGVRPGVIKSVREGGTPSAKVEKRIQSAYRAVQYTRLRAAGLNVKDARAFRAGPPSGVNKIVRNNVRLAQHIAKVEILNKYTRRVEKAIKKGGKMPNKPTQKALEKKIKAILANLRKSKVLMEDRDKWLEQYVLLRK